MTVTPELYSLNIDIPAQPGSLAKLSELLASQYANFQAAATLIESDMALAAAVLKAANSSMYGLRGRVQTVQQAITYLGMYEVAGITFSLGLKASFPPVTELEPLWKRAARRGLIMGRLGQQLSVDPWAAHSAGLFEECGKAVLFRHSSVAYRALLAETRSDLELCEQEQGRFGVSHDALGAALCESWGLAPAAVASVRHHVQAQATMEIPHTLARRSICGLSVVAQAMMSAPDTLAEVIERIAPQADLDLMLVTRAVQRVRDKLEAAEEGD